MKRWAVVGVVLFTACNRGEPSGDPGAPPPSAGSAARAEATPSATASATAASSAANPSGSVEALAGTWEGSYEAKKGTVAMPKDVKDAARKKDDGKASSGHGTITMTISPSGDISGTGKGALGDFKLSGKVDEKIARASIMPDDPTAPTAMTGVLVAMVKDGGLHGEIHVAGPDATVVRESQIDLKKK